MLKAFANIIMCGLIAVMQYPSHAQSIPPSDAASKAKKYNDAYLLQLTAMQTQMHKGAAEKMQEVYPEGFVFMQALYGLSWAEYGKTLDKTTQAAVYTRAETEIKWTLTNLNSPTGRGTFPKNVAIPYGAFYTGWCNYLLGQKLSMEPTSKRDSVELRIFESQCRTIAAYIDSSTRPYAETYPLAAWPADMTVCVASLALHDKILTPKYTATLRKWITEVKQHLDKNGLMPHAVNYHHGAVIHDARGSSQSLMLCFLSEIDPAFAAKQFQVYRRLFLSSVMGMSGIREYPEGNNAAGDVDSGPILAGMGSSATVVSIRTMTVFGDTVTAAALRGSIDAFRTIQMNNSQTKSIRDRQPIAEAFLTWANAAALTVVH